MEKPKSFKETMSDIKTQYKKDMQHANSTFKANREQDKIKSTEMKQKMKEKPKTKRKSSLDTSGGKNDVFNLFAQMILGFILSIPIFLIGLFAILCWLCWFGHSFSNTLSRVFFIYTIPIASIFSQRYNQLNSKDQGDGK
ncbi:hypothetical protein QWY16_07580 [Planococcus shenhongbingii]|uniref:hypothetical protein n=1 Tax=Planococcus shenhongbingii TaxID=3058398 RepID=UPI00263335F7|nr:hypothetical protein [Planococcus sp. N016]WKA59957.1 hypothetical protein QWY16_07580 [Planococcus sp. N016]